MSVVKRIKEYLDFIGVTNQKFEIEVGYSNGAFGSQLKNNKTIGSDKLEYILKIYPNINSEWLLTGEGNMLKSSGGVGSNKLLQDVIIDKEKIIAMLEKENKRLEQENAELKQDKSSRSTSYSTTK